MASDPAALAPATGAPVVLACAHGTRDRAGQRAVAALVAALGPALDGEAGEVVATWVDVQEPDLAQRTREYAGQPAVTLPLLLSAGYHVHVDMDRAVAGHPRHTVAAALGPDPRLAAVLADRLGQALARRSAPPPTRGDTVIMAAAGSSKPAAVRDCAVTAGLLGQRLGIPVRAAYLSAASPSLAEAVRDARRDRTGRVLVATYLLAPGFFHDRALAAGADITAEPLLTARGDVPAGLVDLAAERYRCAALRVSAAASRLGRVPAR